MLINSPDFTHEGLIPSKYTCDGEDTNPPITISYVPPAAQSLAIIVEDPDAPAGLWVHWMVWNIPPETPEILSGKPPKGVVGKNSYMQNEWGSIAPPDGEHRYYFKVFALDTILDLDPETTTREQLYEAMEEHTLAHETIMGKYIKIPIG